MLFCWLLTSIKQKLGNKNKEALLLMLCFLGSSSRVLVKVFRFKSCVNSAFIYLLHVQSCNAFTAGSLLCKASRLLSYLFFIVPGFYKGNALDVWRVRSQVSQVSQQSNPSEVSTLHF